MERQHMIKRDRQTLTEQQFQFYIFDPLALTNRWWDSAPAPHSSTPFREQATDGLRLVQKLARKKKKQIHFVKAVTESRTTFHFFASCLPLKVSESNWRSFQFKIRRVTVCLLFKRRQACRQMLQRNTQRRSQVKCDARHQSECVKWGGPLQNKAGSRPAK